MWHTRKGPASLDVRVMSALFEPVFLTVFDSPSGSHYFGKGLPLFSFSGQSETNNVLCPPVFAEKALWDLEAWKRLRNTQNHRKHPEENVLSLSLPFLPLLPAATPHRQWIWDQRAWERSKVRERKHRWLSDGLALSDSDLPTQSQHLRGHFHEASEISRSRPFHQPAQRRRRTSYSILLFFTNVH